MARYCFYCGRELGENERCTCRASQQIHGSGNQAESSQESRAQAEPEPATAATSGAANAARSEPQKETTEQAKAAESGKAQADEAASRKAASKKSESERQQERQARREEQARARDKARAEARAEREAEKEKRRARWHVRGEDVRKEGKRWAGATGGFLRQVPTLVKNLFVDPDAITERARSSTFRQAVIAAVLEVLIASSILALGANNTAVGRYLNFTVSQLESGPATRLLGFGTALILVLLAYAFRVLFYMLALKINFISVSFQQAMIQAVPGSLYFSTLMLFGFFFTRSSGFQLLFIWILAWGFRLLADYRVLDKVAGVQKGRLVLTLFGVYLLTFMAVAMSMSWMLPEITRVPRGVGGFSMGSGEGARALGLWSL